jgi:predicted ATP-grasp superfamily ATP-dependent carboligase
MAPPRTEDTVIVPAKYSPSCYACIRSLKRRGVRTVVPSGYDDPPATRSRYCDEAVSVPSPHDDLIAYRDALLELAARSSARTIIPIFEEDAYLLSKYREHFAEHVDLVVPPLGTLATAYDRVELAAAAESAGVPVPETTLLSDVDDWSGAQIVKSRYNLLTPDRFDEYSASESHMIKDQEYLEPGEAPEISATVERMRHEPIVQTLIPARDQYVFGALYEEGSPVTTFQHRQVRGETYAGGGGSYRESVAVPKLERAGRDLLNELDWHGLACVEFRRHEETGEFVLIELNPRIWRSTAVAVESGADFPSDYLSVSAGDAAAVDSTYRTGVGMHFTYGEFTYLRSVLESEYSNVERPSLHEALRDVAVSTVAHPRFDYLHLDDPQPFVRGLVNAIR